MNFSIVVAFDLLKLRLCSTYFQWRDTFYEQTGSAAMGSSSQFWLGSLRDSRIQLSHQTQILGTFCGRCALIWSHGKDELKLSLQYMSGIHPSMNFTMKTEESNFRYLSWMSFSLEILLVFLGNSIYWGNI